MTWLVDQVESGEVHIVPVGDDYEHSEIDCLCGPTTAPVARSDGSFGWTVSHHSLDGREAHE